MNVVMTSPVNFLRETYEELKKVTWPKNNDVIRLTIAVIVISIIIGFYIGGIDALLATILTTIIK